MLVVAVIASLTYFALKIKCNKKAKEFFKLKESDIVKGVAQSFCEVTNDYGIFRDSQFFYTINSSSDKTTIFKEDFKISFTLKDFMIKGDK